MEEKTLDDLEIGDEVISPDGEICKMTDKGYYFDNSFLTTLETLKLKGYQVYNKNKIKTLSPSEAETLLEENLGIKVKIKLI